jgi:hypothetical protein
MKKIYPLLNKTDQTKPTIAGFRPVFLICFKMFQRVSDVSMLLKLLESVCFTYVSVVSRKHR